MFIRKPLLGHGIDGFRKEYMGYQADYFREYPQSTHSMLADNVEYVYNDFIKITVEAGFIGLILFLSLVLFSLIKFQRTFENMIVHDGFIVLLVFALFSYPSDIYVFLVLFCFFVGNLQKTFFSLNPCRQFLICAFCIPLPVVFWGINQMNEYNMIDRQIKKINTQKGIMNGEYIFERYPKLKHHPQFMAWFARQSFQRGNMNHILLILEDALKIYPCVEVYCDLGVVYQRNGEYEKAKLCYTTASNMIPSRIYPKYRLFKLYLHSKDTVHAQEIANQILSTSVKIENTVTLRIKAEVKKTLNNYLNKV